MDVRLDLAAFTFTIESRDSIQSVKVHKTDGLRHTRMILRKKYSFDEWRIVNIAALYDKLKIDPREQSQSPSTACP